MKSRASGLTLLNQIQRTVLISADLHEGPDSNNPFVLGGKLKPLLAHQFLPLPSKPKGQVSQSNSLITRTISELHTLARCSGHLWFLPTWHPFPPVLVRASDISLKTTSSTKYMSQVELDDAAACPPLPPRHTHTPPLPHDSGLANYHILLTTEM